MKISQLAKSLMTVLALPVCGTALTAGAMALESAFLPSPIVQDAETDLGAAPATNLVAQDATQEQNAAQEKTFDSTDRLPEMDDPTVEIKQELKKVDDSVSGWNQADPTAELNIGDKLRSSWVMLDAQGTLSGQIAASGTGLADAKVFFIRNGRLQAELVSDAEGNFAARGIGQGTYTVFVHAANRYAISGLIVLEHDNQAKNFKSKLEVNVSDESTKAIYELITDRATDVGFRDYGEFAFGETAEDPARLYGIKGLSQFKPEAIPATTNGNYRVSMSAEGTFIGRLHAVMSRSARPVDLQSMDVFILKNSEYIQSAQTDRFGVFQVSGLEAGVYTLLGAGKDGVIVAGFELVSDTATETPALASIPSNATQPADIYTSVAMQEGDGFALDSLTQEETPANFLQLQPSDPAAQDATAGLIQEEIASDETAQDVAPAPRSDADAAVEAEDVSPPTLKSVEESKDAAEPKVAPQAARPAVPPTTSFDGTLAPREDIGWVNSYMLDNPYVDTNLMAGDLQPCPNCGINGAPMLNDCCNPGGFGGGGVGGSGGFGGGGFGGGGLGFGGAGRFALPLAAAAIAAIAIADDDDNARIPRPVSPFRR